MNIKNVLLITLPVAVITSLATYFLTQNYSNNTQEFGWARQYNNSEQNQGYGMGMGQGMNGTGNNNRGNCLADDCLAVEDLNYPVADLPTNVVSSLNKAIDDEYKAYSTYEAVIEKFGNVRPFIMIIRAEEQHIASLKAIFDKYGLEIPQNTYLGNVTAPATTTEACSIGIQAEIDNAALYRAELLPAVADYADITAVYTNLMNASQNKHLPAFERCGM